jgi:hypothetical protein
VHILDATNKMKLSEWIHIGWNKQISLARPLVRLQDVSLHCSYGDLVSYRVPKEWLT